MTQIIIVGGEQIIGDEKSEVKKLIEFHKLLNGEGEIKVIGGIVKPMEFATIELISLNYSDEFDLIFAYNENRSAGILFLGKWNDGIAE